MPSFELDPIVLDLPSDRLWAALRDGNRIFPKAMPELFASIDVVEGTEAEPGSVRITKLGPAAPEGAYSKEKLLVVDQATKTVVEEEVEGGHLALGFTKWKTTFSLADVGADKTKLSFVFDYDGAGPAIDPAIEDVKQRTPLLLQTFANYVAQSGAY